MSDIGGVRMTKKAAALLAAEISTAGGMVAAEASTGMSIERSGINYGTIRESTIHTLLESMEKWVAELLEAIGDDEVMDE